MMASITDCLSLEIEQTTIISLRVKFTVQIDLYCLKYIRSQNVVMWTRIFLKMDLNKIKT